MVDDERPSPVAVTGLGASQHATSGGRIDLELTCHGNESSPWPDSDRGEMAALFMVVVSC